MSSNRLNSGFQDQTEQPSLSRPKRSLTSFLLLTHAGWRIVGGVAITGAGFMAWYGSDAMLNPKEAAMPLWLYWGAFLLLMLAAMVAVLLDIRYVRLRFLLEERAMYEKMVRGKTEGGGGGTESGQQAP